MEYATFGHYALRFFLLVIISFSVVFGSFYIIGVAGFEAGADFWRVGANETVSPPAMISSPSTEEQKPPSYVPSPSSLLAESSPLPTPYVLPSASSSTLLSPSPTSTKFLTAAPSPYKTPSPKTSNTSPSPSSFYKAYPSSSPSFSYKPSPTPPRVSQNPAYTPTEDSCADQWFGARLINSLFNNCQPVDQDAVKEKESESAVSSYKFSSPVPSKLTLTKQQKNLLTKEEQKEYRAQARAAGLSYATANLKKELIISLILASLGTFFWWLADLGRLAI